MEPNEYKELVKKQRRKNAIFNFLRWWFSQVFSFSKDFVSIFITAITFLIGYFIYTGIGIVWKFIKGAIDFIWIFN